jgi:hypothetical protein
MSLDPESLFILNTLKSKELHIASTLDEYESVPLVHHTHAHNRKSFAFNSDPLINRSWFQIIIDSSHLITFFISIMVIIYASFKSLRIDKNLSETKSAECTSECLKKQGCLHFNSDVEKNDNAFKEKNSYAKDENEDSDDSDVDDSDDDNDHGILGRNGKYGSVQTIDSKLALLIPVAASMSLLLMFYFFESIQTAFVICTSSKKSSFYYNLVKYQNSANSSDQFKF